jgi:hypothetical protein
VVASAPRPDLPTAVRTVLTMTASFMMLSFPLSFAGGNALRPRFSAVPTGLADVLPSTQD